MKKIVGFTGTQVGMTAKQKESFVKVLNECNAESFRHGDCIGADADAHGMAVDMSLMIHIHPPENPYKRAYCESGNPVVHGVKPYLMRNKDIVDASQILIATPQSKDEVLKSGTWSTVRYARKKHRPIFIINPDGSVAKENCD